MQGFEYKVPDARRDDRDSDDVDYCYLEHDDNVQILAAPRKRPFTKVQYIPMAVLAMLTVLVFFVPLLDQVAQNALHKINNDPFRENTCSDVCSFSLVESIPEGLDYKNSTVRFPSTYETWKDLIEKAKESIEIASFYWTMKGEDVVPHPSAKQGEAIFGALIDAGTKRNIKIKIVESAPDSKLTSNDTEVLRKLKAADVRSVNFTQLLGAGVLHTKLWIIDKKDFYVGSANMDWRALTQVKELGIVGRNCECLASDLKKIFEVYWILGHNPIIPSHWNDKLSTATNIENPIRITDTQNNSYTNYISSSPSPLCPSGRTNDIDSIVDTIRTAKEFIHVAVMDYLPLMLYTSKVEYWDAIDRELRKAAINGIRIRMLISRWTHSRESEDRFLKSMMELSGSYKWVSIEIRRFVVPSSEDQDRIPFARVNHNKYMVTDRAAYIGTSNWSADYFTNTAGVGLVFYDWGNSTGIRKDLQNIFERDWTSNYSFPIN